LLPWLLSSAPLTELPLSPAEQAALAEIQRTLTLKSLPGNLLPRASALVPQVIALLRQTELPLGAITQRVSRDAALSAEVMRLASSPFYRAQGELCDLQQAITLIGAAGLQTVIARVVLRPLFQDASGLQAGGTAQRMWEHSQSMARHAAALAGPAGQPSFDAYLAGLLHNTGWKVAFHVLERAGIALEAAPSHAFAQALSEQTHRLFGHVAHSWEITPGFTAFASDARAHGLAFSAHPLAPVLRAAHQHSLNENAAAG
jgi:HD-like signal output (HDOD) protein